MTKLELLQNEIDSLKNNFEHDLKLLETKLRDYIDVRKEPYNSEWREEPYDRHDPNGLRHLYRGEKFIATITEGQTVINTIKKGEAVINRLKTLCRQIDTGEIDTMEDE